MQVIITVNFNNLLWCFFPWSLSRVYLQWRLSRHNYCLSEDGKTQEKEKAEDELFVPLVVHVHRLVTVFLNGNHRWFFHAVVRTELRQQTTRRMASLHVRVHGAGHLN